MRILLDTHIIIWMLEDSRRLSPRARELILDPTNRLYYSTVSVWEVALKREKRGEDELSPGDFTQYCRKAKLVPLPITEEHALSIGELPLVHKDPFDRMLLSQAISEGMCLMTHDDLLAGYDYNGLLRV